MVKAMAPKAPIGAAFIRMWTRRNTGAVSASRKVSTGRPLSPVRASATPNSTATNSTCRMLPSTKALTRVAGMMSIANPVRVSSWDFST
ncbi:hypothetical protein D3C71_2037460 [compost metagenome]